MHSCKGMLQSNRYVLLIVGHGSIIWFSGYVSHKDHQLCPVSAVSSPPQKTGNKSSQTTRKTFQPGILCVGLCCPVLP